ncbi:hypothetical protein H1R20_g815, partial [Candolleomyces eurysporus]
MTTITNVKSLPNEILESVFIFAHPEVDVFHEEYFGGSSTWTLSHVSRTWRSVVLGSKPLWRRLLLQGNPYHTLQAVPVISRLCLAVARSAPIPFSVRVTDPEESELCDEVLDPLSSTRRSPWERGVMFGPIFANAYRLETLLEEDCFIDSAYHMLSLFPMHFPALRVLQLNGEAISDDIGEDIPIPRIAPVLRRLHLTRFKLDEEYQAMVFSSLNLPWGQITHLTADCCNFEKDETGEKQLFNIQRFLNHFPNLQTLTWLFDEDEGEDWDVEDLELDGKEIKTIDIRGTNSVMVPLLGHTRAPNLQKLQLDLLDGPYAQDWQSEDSEYTTSEASQRSWSPHIWEPRFLETISNFIDRLHDKGSMTSLVLHGFYDLPVLHWIQQLPNLRVLSVHLMDRPLVKYLTWSGSHHTLPFLESLTWNFDSAATKKEDQRIVRMVESRTNPTANSVTAPQTHFVRIRLLHEPQDAEIVNQSFLVKQLGAVRRIYLEIMGLEDLEWHPLRLYE